MEIANYSTKDLINSPKDLLDAIGQAANNAAAEFTFADYRQRRSENTLTRQNNDLANFTAFLKSVGVSVGDLAATPEAWKGITWGLVKAFQVAKLQDGYAVSTVNFMVSTVKVYASLAAQAGHISTGELALIKLVAGYGKKEIQRIDEKRITNRKGPKKAVPVSISPDQARVLKCRPDTPQGRRDAVIMFLLLDHGLRCGELSVLRTESINLDTREMCFYRPKVQREQTHALTNGTMSALQAYLERDNFMQTGLLLLGSRKGGMLSGGMSDRAITKRVAYLGKKIGLEGLSAHDCRHYWATSAARNGTPLDRLQDAGGWSSLAMPSRYIESAKIANMGVNLGE